MNLCLLFSVTGVDWGFFSVIGELQLTGEQVAKHYWVAGGQVGQDEHWFR